MKKIRVANVSFSSGSPFRALSELDFIDYQENLPQENARRLFEREIDVALLPINSFASSGAYVGLDFGIAAERNYSQLHIFSHRPIETLDTIYVFEGSSAAVFLLRLLLFYRYRCSPRIVSKRRLTLTYGLLPNEGMLVQPEHEQSTIKRFRYEVDLVKEWYDLTELPFVFLLWATRSGVLDWNQHRLFYDQCHRVISAYHRAHPHEKDHIIYHFDRRAKAGIERTFHDAYCQNMLPESTYVPGTYTLLDRKPKSKPKEKDVSLVLREVMEGKRIGMEDALTLAEQAKLSDLSMVAEYGPRMRQKNPTLRLFSVLQESHGEDQLFFRIDKALKAKVKDIRFITRQNTVSSLTYYESLIEKLKSSFDIHLQAFTPRSLLLLAEKESLQVQEVASRLLACGVDEISAAGTGMLIDRILKERNLNAYRANDYTRAIKWVHRYGGVSSARLTISSLESWEERIIHLQKLRTLQDTNPGFRTFCLRTQVHSSLSLDERLRAYLIARIYLDNIELSKELVSSVVDLGKLFRLNFGVDEVCYYDFGDHPEQTSKRFQRFFQKTYPHHEQSAPAKPRVQNGYRGPDVT